MGRRRLEGKVGSNSENWTPYSIVFITGPHFELSIFPRSIPSSGFDKAVKIKPDYLGGKNGSEELASTLTNLRK
jgi:hypothetical protein